MIFYWMDDAPDARLVQAADQTPLVSPGALP
jgi:hypothetical protein